MCPSNLFIFDEFDAISTQVNAVPDATARCANSVVRGYHVYMVQWNPAIGVKFNAETEVSKRRDRRLIDCFSMATDIDGVSTAMASRGRIDGTRRDSRIDGNRRDRWLIDHVGGLIPSVQR